MLISSYPHRPPPNSEKVEYLKMLLAEGEDDVFRSVRSRIKGRPIKEVTRPLAAAYLSGIVRQVRECYANASREALRALVEQKLDDL